MVTHCDLSLEVEILIAIFINKMNLPWYNMGKQKSLNFIFCIQIALVTDKTVIKTFILNCCLPGDNFTANKQIKNIHY